jgi:glycosyltransferase involved in cell wall biosynthesis
LTLSTIALLGRKDEPTDAVEEYCRYLGEALKAHDISLEIERVPWAVNGWPDALRELEGRAAAWRDRWVLVQYTALAWSARGFPQKFLGVLKILRTAAARVAVVFHDVEPYPGTRIIDSFRRAVQLRTMRRAVEFADLSVFVVPPGKLSWHPKTAGRMGFVPVGANLPVPLEIPTHAPKNDAPTIGVFSITGGDAGVRETKIIVRSVRFASQKLGKLRLSVFGRHAELREQDLRNGLRDLPVQVTLDGVVSPELVVERLSGCDVLFFVRGGISSRRGSAIAGIACGVPVIAFAGSETAAPITDAGVVLVPPHGEKELGEELVRVLSDGELRAGLRLRNAVVYAEHLSWAAIGKRFAALLGG